MTVRSNNASNGQAWRFGKLDSHSCTMYDLLDVVLDDAFGSNPALHVVV